MNREQMIEKAARAIHASEVQAGLAADTWEENDQNWYLLNAFAAVSALLPQVATVAELEALPQTALLVDEVGYAMRRVMWRSEDLPLTVVWQP